MEPFSHFFSPWGRIAPKPFALGVLLLYVLIVASQALLSVSVIERAGVAPFALVQAMLTWAWYALHAKRLRDARRSAVPALVVAIVYALGAALLVLIAQLFSGTNSGVEGQGAGGGFGLLLVIILLIALLNGDTTTIGWLVYVAVGLVVVILMPLAIALGFSVWAGTRDAAPAPTEKVLP